MKKLKVKLLKLYVLILLQNTITNQHHQNHHHHHHHHHHDVDDDVDDVDDDDVDLKFSFGVILEYKACAVLLSASSYDSLINNCKYVSCVSID